MARKDGLSADGPDRALAERRLGRRGRLNEAHREWAKRKLAGIQTEGQVSPASTDVPAAKSKSKFKSKNAKPKVKARRTALNEAAARTEVNKLVPKEAQRNGDYRFVLFEDIEVTEGGKRVKKERRVVRNQGGTPIERWHARGALDERQMAAILFYQQAWHTWIGEQRIVANWSAVIVRAAVGAIEIYAGTRIAAKESLRLLDQEVFFREPVDHFHVWQNVVIFDEPAGVAGSRAGFLSTKQSEAAARVIVGGMAHKIADIVIDNSRKDFGDLILDLDAARRPGRKS